MGGEPTLHPNFFEILDIIKSYKEGNPYCKIEISTNGYSKKTNDVLSKLPNWINIRNSKKVSNSNKFDSYNVAPIDTDQFKVKDFSNGCWITEYIGLGLTGYGFYTCGAGASVDRVFGFDIGIKHLNLVNKNRLKKQLNVLCRYCGHFMTNYIQEQITEEKISESWRKAYIKYKTEKPNLVLY